MSTGAHSRAAGSGLTEEQAMTLDAENPGGFRQSWSIGHEQDEPFMRLKSFLHRAAVRGDWKSAEAILREDKTLASLKITQSGDTALHMAAGAKQVEFVRKLIKLMSDEELALPNNNGETVYWYATASGVVEIAKLLYERNATLPTLRFSVNNMTALHLAALLGKREMVSYLYTVTPRHILQPKEIFDFFEAIIHIDMFDLALHLFNTAARSSAGTEIVKIASSALRILARKPAAVTTSNQEWMRKKFLIITRSLQYIPWMKRIHDDMLKRKGANQLISKLLAEIFKLPDDKVSEQLIGNKILGDAVEVGNVEFLAIILRSYPDLIWRADANGHSIFHVAVLNRQENVFKLIYDIGAYKDLIALLNIDKNDGNNILHLAGIRPPESILDQEVCGAALQMQRELLWFKEVENIVPPSFLKTRNRRGQTPRGLFLKQHKSLFEEGVTWIKDTANYCMVVATLIATVVFAAAFTVPGGSNGDTGIPVFLNATWFDIFVISDVVGMFSSAISIILFLTILTSRYTVDDFLVSIHTTMMFGLTALFFSVVSMVVAFTSVFFLIYKYQGLRTPRLIIAFAGIPIIVFALLQSKTWIDTIRSIWWSKFKLRPGKIKLYT